MIYALNFASEGYEKARELNTKTAYKFGADKVFEFTLNDIDVEFANKNKSILCSKRGCGYWLWKPYFINKVLKQSNQGDWIIYSDSGMYYRTNIIKYINMLEKNNISMISRTTKFMEKQFTKRDVFVELDCDFPEYTDSLQRAASVVLIKNNIKNQGIIDEWLEKAQNEHLITDSVNRSGKENYSEFIDHRHDQSLFSITCKQHNVSYNKNLFLDMILPIKKGALLVDHHTKAGNKLKAFLLTIKRVFFMMIGDLRRYKKGQNK